MMTQGTLGGQQSAATYEPDDQPAFVIGVTGHVDPGDAAEIEKQIRYLFHFLRWDPADARRREAAAELRGKLPELANMEQARKADPEVDPEKTYDVFFERWPGLEKTPIVVLSSLAPGADQIVAKVALEEEFRKAGFQLRCPLPFPLEVYRHSSSFVWKAPDAATEHQRDQVLSANAQRQNDFDAIVDQLGEDDHFVVAIEDDLEWPHEKLSERYRDEVKDASRRHRRYQGAGEYIAAHCHLMIAIWDHVDDGKASEGTGGIVHARRYGLTRGLLPTTRELALPAEDAILQIYTKRQKRAAREGLNPATQQPDPAWRLRWLFAYATREQLPGPYGRSLDGADASWQQLGLSRLLRMTQLLVEFNQRQNANRQSAHKQLSQLLSDGTSNFQSRLKESSPQLYRMIKRLADFRRRAADEQRNNESHQAHSTLVWLFWLTLGAASLSHTHNHWHSQLHPTPSHVAERQDSIYALASPHIAFGDVPSPASQRASGPSHGAAEPPAGDGQSEAQNPPPDPAATTATSGQSAKPSAQPVQPEETPPSREPAAGTSQKTIDAVVTFLIGLIGIGLAGYALYFFGRRRPLQHNEKSDDLRAIAEGARVQLMWDMSGVGESVPSSYMQRQRSELSWIRQAIKSVSMPYEQPKWLFDALEPDLQIGLLRCVYYQWIRGSKGAQANYFADSREKIVAAIHFWHKTGCLWALAGLWLAVLYVIHSFGKILEFDLFQSLSQRIESRYLDWLPAMLVVGLLLVILTVRFYALEAGKSQPSRWKEGWDRARWKYFDPIVEWFLPTEEAHAVAHAPMHFREVMWSNFVIYARYGLIVAILAALLGVYLSQIHPLLPALANWIIIFSAWLLIAGGLSLAWPERNLYSELAYQYGTMQVLFSMAADRIEPLIDQLEDLYRTSSDRCYAGLKACRYKSQLPSSEQATFDRDAYTTRLQAEARAEYPKLLRRIQLILYDLGTESLDENAEWLILHRARPLEPVMAG